MLGNPQVAKQSVGMNPTNAARRGPIIPWGTPQRNYQHLVDAGVPLQWEQRASQFSGGTDMNGWTQNGPPNPGVFSGSIAHRGMPDWANGFSKPRGAQLDAYRQSMGVTGSPFKGTQQGSFAGIGNIQTSIQPKPIYQPWMTTTAVNTAQAQADQASNAPYLMKMFDRPGVSRSDAHFAAIAPLVAENQVNAATARATIPFEDAAANERNLFLGQVARENEGLQLGNLLARFAEAQQQSQLGQLSRYSNLLSGLVG